jgi:hypothetical protein
MLFSAKNEKNLFFFSGTKIVHYTNTSGIQVNGFPCFLNRQVQVSPVQREIIVVQEAPGCSSVAPHREENLLIVLVQIENKTRLWKTLFYINTVILVFDIYKQYSEIVKGIREE